ncbi:phage tail protein [Paenibacillus hexagrammi]|uniref:Tail fiber protein n=1 Tax=Paenibacillus hexagrammi TaxID=2908839 RepID=A0ABY3SIF8_9BACL|nr:tail fiber protein [Paenibacillus sp. YPD9-1]UJF33809.1 tail fiber protein [Paenibacillus sp. YPD9-1]
MEPFLAEIRAFSFNFAPKGWAMCNGQLLPIQQNTALFSLIGTTYGGDGRTTFALPNLQGKVVIHRSSSVPYGTNSGEAAHTLTVNEMPMHTHQATGGSDTAISFKPTGATWGTNSNDYNLYQATANDVMSASSLSVSGGSQPHSNMQPYTTLNYCIALTGIFPPRS